MDNIITHEVTAATQLSIPRRRISDWLSEDVMKRVADSMMAPIELDHPTDDSVIYDPHGVWF